MFEYKSWKKSNKRVIHPIKYIIGCCSSVYKAFKVKKSLSLLMISYFFGGDN
ncbi:hypothetical protein FM106_12520 [Brachybacterium faecium]|nr:hypothetical protein FM106_12520 [Brachybacterium faecium]